MTTSLLPPFPIIYLVLQKSLIALLVAFTPQGSILRPIIFPLLVLYNYHLLPTYVSYIPRSPWINIVSGEILTELLDYLEKLLLSQWSFETYGPSVAASTAKKADKETIKRPIADGQMDGVREIWERLKFGAWVTISTRYIGSPYQARNVPPYSNLNPFFVPTRLDFLLKWSIRFIVCYIVLDVLAQTNQPEKSPIVYAESYVPFFSRLTEVTIEEFMTRIFTTIFYWIAVYAVVQGYYTGLALLSVSSGLDRPELWRPNCGPLSEAYTIRGFWSLFWHQFLRKKLTKPARYITFHVFNLPRAECVDSKFKRLLARYTELFFVFLISGLLHHATEVAQGMAWTESGATTFFVMMAVGVMIEDVAQWAFYDLMMGGGVRGQSWAKALGFLWVLLFFTYATPFWAYPHLRKNTGGVKNEILPLSVIANLKAK